MNETQKMIFDEAANTVSKTNQYEIISILAVVLVVALASYLSFRNRTPENVQVNGEKLG
jgi:hypothetical protein